MSLNVFHGKKYFDAYSVTGTPVTAASGTPSTSGQRVFVTDIAGSSDKAGALLRVKDGDEIIFSIEIGDGTFSHRFESPLIGTADQTMKVEITDGTSVFSANIAGFIA